MRAAPFNLASQATRARLGIRPTPLRLSIRLTPAMLQSCFSGCEEVTPAHIRVTI
jgi:hypothetical protein